MCPQSSLRATSSSPAMLQESSEQGQGWHRDTAESQPAQPAPAPAQHPHRALQGSALAWAARGSTSKAEGIRALDGLVVALAALEL